MVGVEEENITLSEVRVTTRDLNEKDQIIHVLSILVSD